MSKPFLALMQCVLLSVPVSIYAQDTDTPDQSRQGLSLFESIEVTENRSQANSRATREARATVSEPEFTLLGTSRVGGKYSAILRHRNGESILVRSQQDVATAIEGHAGYSVLSVGAGELSLRYPAGVPCVEDVQKGVSCGAGTNTAELVLTASDPLSQPVAAVPDEIAEPAEGTVESTNPFEALRAAQADRDNPAQSGAVRNDRFVPRRIEPADVPPGMRVVSTPFGDRLVEQ